MRPIHAILLIYLVLMASVHARADSSSADRSFNPAPCAVVYARIFYRQYEQVPRSDKYKHCAVSCGLTLMCGAVEAGAVGVLKEIYDFFGPGTAQCKDLRADREGILIGLRNDVYRIQDCNDRCGKIYL